MNTFTNKIAAAALAAVSLTAVTLTAEPAAVWYYSGSTLTDGEWTFGAQTVTTPTAGIQVNKCTGGPDIGSVDFTKPVTNASGEACSIVALWYTFYTKSAAVTNVLVPDTVTSISDYAFFSCTRLTNCPFSSLITPHLQAIGTSAFNRCYATGAVAYAGSYLGPLNMALTFYQAKYLTEAIMPNVTVLPTYVFSGCTQLRKVRFAENVTWIGPYAIPANVTDIGSLTNLSAVTYIGAKALYQSPCFKDISIVCPAATIGNNALYEIGATNLTLTSPDLTIYDAVAQSAGSLQSVTLPQNITNIAANSFSDCKDLVSVRFLGPAPTTVGADIFKSAGPSAATRICYVSRQQKGWCPGNPNPAFPWLDAGDGTQTNAVGLSTAKADGPANAFGSWVGKGNTYYLVNQASPYDPPPSGTVVFTLGN